MILSKKSSYNGIINGDNTAKNIELVLDKTSKIKLKGNSYVTKLTNGDSSNSNINFNGDVMCGQAISLSRDSKVTNKATSGSAYNMYVNNIYFGPTVEDVSESKNNSLVGDVVVANNVVSIIEFGFKLL